MALHRKEFRFVPSTPYAFFCKHLRQRQDHFVNRRRKPHAMCYYAPQGANEITSVIKSAFKSQEYNTSGCVWQPHLQLKKVLIGHKEQELGGYDQKCFAHYALYHAMAIMYTMPFVVSQRLQFEVWNRHVPAGGPGGNPPK